jgi:hypothetical protein
VSAFTTGDRRQALWLFVLGVVCAFELLTHAGARNPFLVSSRPVSSVNELLPGDGYVTWVGTVPVLHDSNGILTLTALFLGSRGPEGSGILDRRAAYAYLASLFVPWAGDYTGFLVLNWLFWWAAAAACFWFVRRRWGDTRLAGAASLLVATGNGFIFMAGVPMSYLAAYATFFLVLALSEWLGAFDGRAGLRGWLLLGWAAGVASTIYFAHIPLLLFWWVYGLRRVAWRHLVAASLVALAISTAWELCGRLAVGLEFTTDNSSAVGASIGAWLSNLRRPPSEVLTYLRGGPVAGAAAIRGTLASAFPYPWWALAAVGFAASPARDRSWALAFFMAGLLPAIVILSLIPLPRAAFYMYPAVYLMAARGALWLGDAVSRFSARAVGVAVTAAALGVVVLTSNLDLLGDTLLITRFHESMGSAWR